MAAIDLDGSVFDAFATVAARWPGADFLRSPVDGESWTYGAAAARVDELTRAYAARGVGAGARVALAWDSRLDVYLHLLALNALGASAVPLNMGGSDDEIRYVIEHSDARLATSLDAHAERLGAIVAGRLPVLTAAGLPGGAAGADAAAVPGEAGREAALLYTSGTTGKPKGCMLSNRYFLTLGDWYSRLDGMAGLRHGDRLVTPLPPNHMNALCTSFMGMLFVGGCVVQLDRFHPSTWWQTLRDERATIIHYLGVMPAILLTLPESPDDSFAGQVRFGFGAGSDPRHQAVFERRFGFPLLEAWAMTETGAGAVTIADREPRHIGQRCIGKPRDGMALRIVDESGRDVPDGEPGELLVRAAGPDPRKGFFSGYYKDPDATESGWQGGWWHTGDVVRRGDDGSLYFVDRRKNVIRRSGENIAAVEVEAVLLACASVANCAVTAVPDEIRGDEVFAFVVLRDGESPGADQARAIFDSCMQRLSYFKAPAYMAFVDALPLTASQKVARGEVKTRARTALDRGECIDLRARKKRPAA